MNTVHCQRILDALRSENGRTALSLARKCSMINVSARIGELRKAGVNIISKYHGLDKHGNRIYRYWLIGYRYGSKWATKNAFKY